MLRDQVADERNLEGIIGPGFDREVVHPGSDGVAIVDSQQDRERHLPNHLEHALAGPQFAREDNASQAVGLPKRGLLRLRE